MIEAAKKEDVPVFVLGGGSNVLFRDEGFPGLVIRVTADSVKVEDGKLIAEAGGKWFKILEKVEAAGLFGLEEFKGLPGTIGGSVAGNSGCFGKEIKDVFESAKIYDREKNEVREVGSDYFEFKYRWSRIKETKDVILEVVFCLDTTPPEGSLTEENSQMRRLDTQPPGMSGGSFFKNPSPDQPAGKLIDECGLKGLQIGGAKISEKHANFFMNVGGATSADLLALRDRAKQAVKEQFGIDLDVEVQIA